MSDMKAKTIFVREMKAIMLCYVTNEGNNDVLCVRETKTIIMIHERRGQESNVFDRMMQTIETTKLHPLLISKYFVLCHR